MPAPRDGGIVSVMARGERSFWRRYRVPIVLAVIALGFYLLSIAWIVLGRGQIA